MKKLFALLGLLFVAQFSFGQSTIISLDNASQADLKDAVQIWAADSTGSTWDRGVLLSTLLAAVTESSSSFTLRILDSASVDTEAELVALVTDISAILEAADNEVITGTWDFGDGGIEIQNGTTLPGTCQVGEVFFDSDATSGQGIYACESANTWVLQGDGGAGGGAIILDLGDDSSNESSAIAEIATTGDTNSIFGEPSPDKLLIAVGNNWPTADSSTGLKAADYGDISSGLGNLTIDNDAVDAAAIATNGVDSDEIAADAVGASEIAADAVGTSELDDDANTPTAGDFVVVEVGDASFDYVTPNAGTNVAADLEEESHQSEHEDGGADEVAVTGGMMNADFGDFTCDGTATGCSLDADVVGTAELDDDANTPVAGLAVVVEAGDASFDYVDMIEETELDTWDELLAQIPDMILAGSTDTVATVDKGSGWNDGNAVAINSAGDLVDAGGVGALLDSGSDQIFSDNVALSGAQSWVVPQTYTASTGNLSIDWNTGNVRHITLDANLILTGSNTNTKAGTTYELHFIQNGTGGFDVSRGSATTLWPDSIIVDPDANARTILYCKAGTNGGDFVRCVNDSYTRVSTYIPAGAFSTDGTGCEDPRKVQINSGPRVYTVLCDDVASSEFYADLALPDGLHDGTLTIEVAAQDTVASPTLVQDIDFSAACRGDGDLINSTFSTAANTSITFATQFDLEQATTATIMPDGTCEPGDHLFIKADIDEAGGNTIASAHILGIKVEYAIKGGD